VTWDAEDWLAGRTYGPGDGPQSPTPARSKHLSQIAGGILRAGIGRPAAAFKAIVTEHAELSPSDWVREQTERILEQGTTDGVEILDRPVILMTVTGAKSGKQRYVPLMRVEKDGRYAMVASKGGDPAHPSWYFNVKANPTVTLQDGDKVVGVTARELGGPEREEWWQRAVEAYPPYAEYQTKTTRLIPVFVLE
jgi:F420H(2)-dependent quinone reductase